MFGGVHNKAAESGSSVNPTYPPTTQPDYEPPNVHNGYDKFISDILDKGKFDSFQGPPPKGPEKKESRLQQFLKWSGIAFALAMGGTILKKAITQTLKGGEKVAEKAVSEGVRHVV